MGGGAVSLYDKIENKDFFNSLKTILANTSYKFIKGDGLEKSVRNIINSLHNIRISGNDGAHSNQKYKYNTNEAFLHLQNLALWFYNEKHNNANMTTKIKLPSILDFIEGQNFTEEQKAFLSEFNAFLNDTSRHIFILRGYAGSGKTYIISVLNAYLNFIDRSNVICSPTGRAAMVINQRLNHNEASTIHRNIYSLSQIQEFKTAESSLKLQNPSIEHKIIFSLRQNVNPSNCVYIFDEASMISDFFSDDEHLRFGSGKLLTDILTFININMKEQNKKVLFVGDSMQLPPINMEISPALDKQYLEDKTSLHITQSTLKEVLRQRGEILKTAQTLRNMVDKKDFSNIYIECNDSDVCEVALNKLLDLYLESHKNNAGDTQVITHTNDNAIRLNKDIRKKLGKKEPLEVGDKLIATKNCYFNGGFIANGEFLTVKKILGNKERKILPLYDKSSKIIELSFIDLELENFENKLFRIKIIYSYFENLALDKEQLQEKDIAKALFIDFKKRFEANKEQIVSDYLKKQGSEQIINIEKRIKDEIFQQAFLRDDYCNALRVGFGYCVTCHKAQGGEWNEVFIDCNAKMSKQSKDYIQWLYTAITRGKKKIYLINPPKKRQALPF